MNRKMIFVEHPFVEIVQRRPSDWADKRETHLECTN